MKIGTGFDGLFADVLPSMATAYISIVYHTLILFSFSYFASLAKFLSHSNALQIFISDTSLPPLDLAVISFGL